jgi:hypothetical protein
MIALAFSFNTETAYKIWEDYVQDAMDGFCIGIRQTPVYGFTRLTDHKGLTLYRNCEDDKIVASGGPESE